MIFLYRMNRGHYIISTLCSGISYPVSAMEYGASRQLPVLKSCLKMGIRNKIILLCGLLAVFVAAGTAAFAQEVRGKVFYTDASGGEKKPAAFATVSWVEGKSGVTADERGEFVLKKLSGEKITLIASFIGYSKDTVVLSPGQDYAEFNLTDENQLDALVVTGRSEANYIAKGTPVKTEVITSAGLYKMACCSLAESFENSASVSVGYSDAITGARQIRLLGLSGSYTQMLDENRPVMRGLSSPFGLSYIPGQWLQSIQISKGPSSVINGLEALTGQINIEHRKPTDEIPFFLNLFVNSNLRTEANVASSLQLNQKWSTVILGHVSADTKKYDSNHDSFRNDPLTRQFNIDNRWLYFSPGGAQVRFGIKAVNDRRIGGQMDFEKGMNDNLEAYHKNIWGSQIDNTGIDGFVKVGVPLNGDGSTNVAFVTDYSYYKTESSFGIKNYDGHQDMVFFNGMFQSRINDAHRYTLGISGQYDHFNENVLDRIIVDGMPDENLIPLGRIEKSLGVYGEYTYSLEEKLSIVAGLRLDYHTGYGWMFAPRANIKYSFSPDLIFRLTAGRGYRMPNVIADNLGVLSSGRKIVMEEKQKMEDAWTFGGSLTRYFPLGSGENSYIGFDYFRTSFNSQLIVDWDKDPDLSSVRFYNSHGRSFTDTYQIDLSLEPIERFTILATFRYTNAKVEMDGQGVTDRPLMSKYKGVLNLQYATPMSKWIFDATLQLNGPCALPRFMGGGQSPVYPMLYAQVTRKFKGIDIYVGGENLTDYMQKNPILHADEPFSVKFNSSMIWGPLMGAMVYAGIRVSVWK